MGAFKGLIVIKWEKFTNPSLVTLSVVVNLFKRLNITHSCLGSLIKLFIYICTQSPSKRTFNKELHIVPFGRVC
jgi:hypothetical protein